MTTDTVWTVEAVEKLKELFEADVPLEVICTTLGREEQTVLAKAAELRIPLHPQKA